MVEQAAGRRDQHVDATRELAVLVVERDAADDERDVELLLDAVFVETLFDLRGELARRLEDERARHARAGTTLLEHGQHREHEGGSLAGAGLRDAEHVAAREHVRDGLVLDRSGDRVAGGGNRRENFFGQAEMGERHVTSNGDRPQSRPRPDYVNDVGCARGKAAEFHRAVRREHSAAAPKVNAGGRL
jgi:hypothetical protein